MAQFTAFEKGIDVNGQTILSVVKGAGVFEASARKFLANNGLLDVKDRGDAWYPQQAWLDTFKEIQTTVGKQTVFLIGKKIPESAQLPPHIASIEDVLRLIDVAYHMNHAKNGKAMFDPASGKMTEGIGHYGYELSGANHVKMECNNPYPCHFDRGLITSFAHRFREHARVEHDNGLPCREKGADSCTYQIQW